MRKFLSALALAIGLIAAPLAAHASSVTYDLSLYNLGSDLVGSGAFTIDAPPSGFADTFVQNGSAGSDLTDLTMSLYGNTFTLADSQDQASVLFLLGTLSSIKYDGALGNGFFKITLDSRGLAYVYTDLLGAQISAGYIVASPAAAATPEPSSLLLFGTGVLGLAAFGARKFAATAA